MAIIAVTELLLESIPLTRWKATSHVVARFVVRKPVTSYTLRYRSRTLLWTRSSLLRKVSSTISYWYLPTSEPYPLFNNRNHFGFGSQLQKPAMKPATKPAMFSTKIERLYFLASTVDQKGGEGVKKCSILALRNIWMVPKKNIIVWMCLFEIKLVFSTSHHSLWR